MRRTMKIQAALTLALMLAAVDSAAAPILRNTGMPEIIFGVNQFALSPSAAEARRARPKDPELDPSTKELIENLARRPELINIEYLKYHIGRPSNEADNRAAMVKNYVWYMGPQRFPGYQLKQTQTVENTISEFIVNLGRQQLMREDVEKLFGAPQRVSYNEHAQPAMYYSLAPNSTLTFIEPHNTFRITSVNVAYRGPTLGVPVSDIYSGHDARRQRVLDMHKKGDVLNCMPVMSEHLKEHPEDAEAHAAMAEMYRSQCRLNEAICEYKTVLSLPGIDPQVANRAMEGLRTLKLIPDANQDGSKYAQNPAVPQL